jgi:pyruvate,water dikinase
MNRYVLSFQEIDRTKIILAGGKGAKLGELSRIAGIQVPDGFCVTTEVYKKISGNKRSLKSYWMNYHFLR